MQSLSSLSTSSLRVREAISPLLNTLPITLSKDMTLGLSVSRMLIFESDCDWRGVLRVALSVEEKRGEVLVERVEVPLPLIAETLWLILEEFVEFSLN